MKLLNKTFSTLVGLTLVAACNNSNTATNSSDSTAAKIDSSNTMSQSGPSGEQDFINYAVPGNTKEIIWLEAGIKKGHNKELKQHAKMMLTDHKKLDSTVSRYLASNRALSAPIVDTANVVNINDKTNMDWDKAWVDKMIDDHSDLLGKLKNSQTTVKDTALLSIINGTIPVVESHLTMVKDLKTKMK